jgi:hypothetical protein
MRRPPDRIGRKGDVAHRCSSTEGGPLGRRPVTGLAWPRSPESAVGVPPSTQRLAQGRSAVRHGLAITAETVWAQLRSQAAVERPALIRGYLEQLAPREVQRLLELSEADAKRGVLERLARLNGRPG